MSAILATIARPEAMKGHGAFSRLLGACWDAIAGYLFRRVAITTLRGLDDHVLHDIGLDRSQIRTAVRRFIPLSPT